MHAGLAGRLGWPANTPAQHISGAVSSLLALTQTTHRLDVSKVNVHVAGGGDDVGDATHTLHMVLLLAAAGAAYAHTRQQRQCRRDTMSESDWGESAGKGLPNTKSKCCLRLHHRKHPPHLQQHCVCQLEGVRERGAPVLHLLQQLVVGDDDERVHIVLQPVDATNSLERDGSTAAAVAVTA